MLLNYLFIYSSIQCQAIQDLALSVLSNLVNSESSIALMWHELSAVCTYTSSDQSLHFDALNGWNRT